MKHIITGADIDKMLSIYVNMVDEVKSLDEMFDGRHFTLDGHFIGSIGEVIAQYCYGIYLKRPSYKYFDGTVNSKSVQIKMVQQDNVMIRYDESDEIPDEAYLLVLYLNKRGRYYEVYNGPFSTVWNSSDKRDKRGYLHISLNKLMALQSDEGRLEQVVNVERMRKEYKNG